MQAVHDFKNSRNKDLKRYKRIYKSKKPDESSVRFFEHVENKYKDYTQKELVDLESYLDDYLSFLEANHTRSKILSGMDYRIVGLLPVFIASLVSVMAILVSATGELFQFADKNGLKNLYEGIAEICNDAMKDIGIVFVVCALFFLLLGWLDSRLYMNKCYEERFINGYIKAIRQCIARKYLDK